MKKLLLILLAIIAIQVKAQVTLVATNYAVKIQGYDWSDWVSTRVSITLDQINDRVLINSQSVQIYQITRTVSETKKMIKFAVIDQDGDYGFLRFVNNGNYTQVYVDFTNISWVYSIPHANNLY